MKGLLMKALLEWAETICAAIALALFFGAIFANGTGIAEAVIGARIAL